MAVVIRYNSYLRLNNLEDDERWGRNYRLTKLCVTQPFYTPYLEEVTSLVGSSRAMGGFWWRILVVEVPGSNIDRLKFIVGYS
jgi:hypothetical protein